MFDYHPKILNRLAFRAFGPVIVLIVLTGLTLYLSIYQLTSDFITSHIKDDMARMSGEIYHIAEDRFTEILKKGLADDVKTIRIKKVLVLSSIIDYMRENHVDGVIAENGKSLQATDSFPVEFSDVTTRATQENTVISAEFGDKELYLYHFRFEPWGWDVYLLKNAVNYSTLINKVQAAYGIIFIILAAATILLVYFMNRNFNAPIVSMVETMEQGKMPEYKGIYEFEFLSDTFRHMIESLERDFAERKRAEQALAQSEEKYRSLVDNINIGIFRCTGSLSGRFLQVNPAMVTIFAYGSVDEFMAVPLVDLLQNPAGRESFLEKLRRRRFLKDKELAMRKKDGTPIWVSCSATVQYDDDGAITWIDGVLEDVTERKKLEHQLRQSQKMEAVGTLAGGIAHDFNNIITAIVGYGSILKMKLADNPPLLRYIEQILASTERGTNLTQSLLAFSRKQLIKPRPVNLNTLVRNTENLLSRLIGEDIELATNLTDADLYIMADGTQIEQVLINLATNARDAMPDGGYLSITTEFAEAQKGSSGMGDFLAPGRYALISVSDTGEGMDEKTRQRIFEPFFTTKEFGKGTGLGLAIVYGIIKQHNGEISVYSEPGKGTSYRIYLPLITPGGEEIEPAGTAPLPRGGTETLLLAEDELEVRKSTKEFLEQFGYRVITAKDGNDAVEKYLAAQDEIRLIILDVIMPKKNGKEVFEEIRKITPDIRAIFTSGYTADIIRRKGALDAGLNFLAKPVPPYELLDKIRKVLDASEK